MDAADMAEHCGGSACAGTAEERTAVEAAVRVGCGGRETGGHVAGTGQIDTAAHGRPGTPEGAFAATTATGTVAVLRITATFTAAALTTTVATATTGTVGVLRITPTFTAATAAALTTTVATATTGTVGVLRITPTLTAATA
ncbi:hypothetical protein AB0N17_43530, partial [Streptomyces sp. NPDC051133]|uniref:hypothetical protein n=1 Tax=Streptomyces sp. NPDC051133 TaxID=3155521 RepID=UPI003415B9E2